ncbi:MAG: hypothetical protein M1835_007379 [Candelina submexicana]|nr:MAG: hypothetical protein M1835_007379 [Candelina submexicana]
MGDWFVTSANAGDDIAVIVHFVGNNITEFKLRIESLRSMESAKRIVFTPNIGSNDSCNSTLPTPLNSPIPGVQQQQTPFPFLIYGALVGSLAIEFARLSNIQPIIVIAACGEKFVEY